MNESQLKKKFKQRWPGFVFNISDRYNSGVPDSWCAYRHRSIWIEFKVDYRKLTKMQQYNMDLLKEHGIKSGVVTYNNKRKQYEVNFDGRSSASCSLDSIINFIIQRI
ncbi:MAG: hypothetical protein FJ150_08565 [Euryarchaeota archaeon]|nr:hypothetical protein [Euryarchaeota archaeon]